PRIRVNSKWGRDVGSIGWKIPLWSRGAAPPDVYPKPAIFVLAAGASPEQRVPLAIHEPEKLYFYTRTDNAPSVHTPPWLPVEGVDYQVIDAAALTAPSPEKRGDPADYKPVVPDLLVKSGLGAFTLALEPPPAAANLVIDRAAETIRAVPRSVTLMRGLD